MKLQLRVAAVIAAFFVALGTHEALLNAQETRANATVKAVRKVKPSVVAIRVPGSSVPNKGPSGTGVIIDERGYIITNRHVVAAADTVIVRFVDDSELQASVVLMDANTDLAILKVRSDKKLPALPLAPAGDLEVGEDVIAIGHPYGYSYTVSKGIISALGRKIELPNGVMLKGLIQTSAPINPGNSGGPLININGEFIGVNTALRDGAQNIAFAINTDTVKRLLSEKLSALKVAGVSHGIHTQEKVVAEKGDRQQLVVIAMAETPGSVGLQPGDVIRCVGSQPVKNSFDLERSLWDSRPGQHVEIRVLREGQELNITLTLTSGDGAALASSKGKSAGQ
jgi:serine protease Do